MAQFVIRVELKDANSDNYDTLHREMAKKEFYQQIQDEVTLKWYHLPQAEYHYKGTIDDRQIIMDMTKQAVMPTNRECEIIVTKSLGTLWHGLEEIS